MTPRQKITIAIIIFIGVSLVIVAMAVIFRPSSKTKDGVTGDQVVTTDKTTGETIIETEGKTPEGLTNSSVLVLGFAKLSDYGLTLTQIDQAQTSVKEYGSEKGKIKKISLDISTLQQKIDQSSGQTDFSGDIVIDDAQRLKVVMSYVGFEDMLVRIYDKQSNQQLYTSGDDAF